MDNRIATLKKKAGELSTLCGSEVGLVCFMPDGSFFTWPPEEDKVRSTLLRYNQLLLHHPNPNLDSKKRKRIDLPNPNPKKRKPNSSRIQTLDHQLVQQLESSLPSDDSLVELGHVLDNQASDDSELESSRAHLQELQVDNQLEEAGFDELVEELESCLPCDDLQGLEKNEPWIQVGDVDSGDDSTHLQQLEPQFQVGHQFGEDQEADSGVLGLTNGELQLWLHPDSTYVQELQSWLMDQEEGRGI